VYISDVAKRKYCSTASNYVFISIENWERSGLWNLIAKDNIVLVTGEKFGEL